jgi:CBS domain-containing protein
MPGHSSPQMMALWQGVLARHLPFSRMEPEHLRALVMSADERYAPPGSALLCPDDGVPTHLYWLRQGTVTRMRPTGPGEEEAQELEAGSLWPAAALLAGRPVLSRYMAHEDCFYLRFPWTTVQRLMGVSSVLHEHLQQMAQSVLQASTALLRQELQAHWPQSSALDQPLSALPAKALLSCPETTPLRQALESMQRRRVGSVLLTGAQGELSGILTRHDLLERVTLREVPLETPISEVMSRPVVCIEPDRLVVDAALQMAQHDIRHLPVVQAGAVLNIVSERDLFELQQQSIHHVSGRIRRAEDLPQLKEAASAIRAFAVQLLSGGTEPQALTRLISSLNDKLTRQVLRLQLARSGLSAQDMCWIALGSEGREEQTLATDQDNALIFASERPDEDRTRWMAFAREVNQVLDACGFPLCSGGVMASLPDWCRTREEWRAQCVAWIEQGSPSDLLKSAVYFDLRPLLGQDAWASELRRDILQRVGGNPRFLQQWVRNHLETGVALNWHGGLATETVQGRATIDVKLSGTAIVVDAARILALSQGIETTSTRDRLLQASQRLGVPVTEAQGWVTAFNYLQTLRLRQQILAPSACAGGNRVEVEALNLVDRQMLKTAFRSIRSLQQRLKLDYLR